MSGIFGFNVTAIINLHILISCFCYGSSNSTENVNISQFHSNNTDFSAFIESYYSITCCRNGKPVPDDSISKFVRNFDSQFAGHVLTDPLSNITCDRYNGKYSIPLKIPITDDPTDPEHQNRNRLDFVNSGVKCKCPDDQVKNLDRNCRQPMADCQNGGYRAFSINLRCVCPGQYFGDLCEKYCSNGQLEKNANNQIFDHCSCRPNFYGDQCEKVVCFNGGTPVNGRGCSCPPFIFGQHCETFMNGKPIDVNFKEWINADGQFVPPPFHVDPTKKQIWDATGAGATIFLLVLIVAFSVYYCTVKRRRRNSTGVTATATHTSRANDLAGTGVNAGQIEMLAPLPTYEEAIKTTSILNVPQLVRSSNQVQANDNSQQNSRSV